MIFIFTFTFASFYSTRSTHLTSSVLQISNCRAMTIIFLLTGLGGSSKKLYLSLAKDDDVYDTTPILFHLSSMSGTFCATPVWAACRSTETVTAYPFLQEDLYSASQPSK